MSLLGTMVVRIAADMARYKVDLGDAADATTHAATRIEGATTKASQAAGRLEGAIGGSAQSAVELVGAVGPAGLALGGLAAVMGVAAYAAYEGAKENKGYVKALALSGNAAGVTSGQLADMARNIDKSVGAQYKAAAALAQMAASGQVAGTALQKYAQVAIETQRAVGTGVQDTVKTFAELGQKPVEASLKLNDAMNYLTASTFAQIKAAQDLGDRAGAAALAQRAYADAQTAANDKIKASMGTLERAWLSLKDTAKGAWDVMLGLGREQGPEQALDAQRKTVENLEKMVAQGGLAVGQKQKLLDAARSELAVQVENVKLLQRAAQAQGDNAQHQKDKIAWLQEGDKYLTKQQKIQREVAAEEQRGQSLVVAGLLTQQEHLKRIAAIRESFAEKGGKAGGNEFATEQDAAKAWAGAMEDASAAMSKATAKADGLTETERKLRDYMVSGAYVINQLTNPAMNEMAVRAYKAVIAREALNKATDAATKADAVATEAHWKYLQGLDQGLVKLQAEIVAENERTARLGLSKEAVATLDMAKLELMATEQERQAIRNLDKNLDEAEYQRLTMTAQAYRDLGKAKAAGAQKETAIDVAKAAADEWKRGWEETDRLGREVFAAWTTDGSNAAQKIGDTLKKALASAIYEATLKPLALQLYTSVVGGQPGGAAGSTLGGLSNLSTIAGAGYQYFTGASAGASSASLAYANGVGMVGGDSLGALISANGGWAGVGVGSAIATGSTAATLGGTAIGGAAGIGSGTVLGGGAATGAAAGTSFSAALAAVPGWGWAAMAAIAILAMSGGKEYVKGMGSANITLGNDGKTTASNTFGNSFDFTTKAATDYVKAISDSYVGQAKSLGIKDLSAGFGYGSNNSDGGKFGVTVGKGSNVGVYSSTDIKTSPEAMQLEAARAVFAALQASELPGYLAKVFNGLTASSATAEQINQTLAFAQGLKAVRDGLLETRDPLQILQDNVDAAFAALGTSASSFKMDFVAAIDAGIAPQALADWQALGAGMAELAAQSGAAADALSATNAKLQDKLDLLTGAQTDRTLELRDATDESTKALLRQIYAQQDANAAQVAAASAASAATAAYNQAAEAAWAEAKAKADAILSERTSLQDQYDQLTLSSAQLLDKQRDALDASNRSLFDQVQALTVAAEAQAKATAAANAAAQASKAITDQLSADGGTAAIALMRAQGLEQQALNAERAIAIKGYTDEQTALYDANTATRALISEMGRMAGVANALTSAVPGVLAKFQTPEQRTSTAYAGIAQGLIDANLTGLDLDTLTNGLISASKDSIAEVLTALVQSLPDSAIEAKLALVTAAGALADLKDAATSAAQSLANAALQAAQAGIGTALGQVQRSVGAGKDAARAAFETQAAIINAQKSSALAVLDINKKAAAAQIDSAKKTYDALTSIIATSVDAAKTLTGDIADVAANNLAQARTFLAGAAGDASRGQLPDAERLKDAIKAVTGTSMDQYATRFEFERDRLVAAGQLQQLTDVLAPQQSAAEAQLAVLQAQLASMDGIATSINSTSDAQIKVAQDAYDAEVKRLDDAYELAKTQAEVALGTYEALKPLPDAIADLAAAIANFGVAKVGVASAAGATGGASTAAATATKGTGSTGTNTGPGADVIDALMQSVYPAWAGQNFGANYIEDLYKLPSGSVAAWTSLHDLPKLAVGTNYIPKDGPYFLHEGEEVKPRAWNPAAAGLTSGPSGGTGGNTARLEALVEALTAKVALLEVQLKLGNGFAQSAAEALLGEGRPPVRVEVVPA